MATHTIETAELYGDSLLMDIVFHRLGSALTVPGACFLWAALQIGVLAGWCWLQGMLLSTGTEGEFPLLTDTSALAYALILPMIFLALYYSMRMFVGHLNGLHDCLEPSAPANAPDALHQIVRRLMQPERSRRLRLLLMTGGVVIFVFNAVANLYPGHFYDSPLKWDGIAHPASYVIARGLAFFVWVYAVPLWLSEVYVQFLVIYRLHATMAERGWIKVSPYSLDQFGGLRSLSVSLSRPGYLVVAAGIFFLAPALRVLANHPLHIGDYIGIGLYALFAAVGTLMPLFLVHRVLARKQVEMLGFLSAAFDQMNARVTALRVTGDISGLSDAELNRGVETVELLRQQWLGLPLWPMSVSLLVKLLAAGAPPAVIYVSQHAKDLSVVGG